MPDSKIIKSWVPHCGKREIRRKMVMVQAELLVSGVVHASADTKVFILE